MEVVPVPTLEMVQAQFHTPSTSAQQEATRYTCIIQLKNVTCMLAAHIIFVDRLPAPAVLSTVHPLWAK